MDVAMIKIKWQIYTVAILPRRAWPGSSFLLVFNQTLAVQQIKYLKHFITIKLLVKADVLGIVDK